MIYEMHQSLQRRVMHKKTHNSTAVQSVTFLKSWPCLNPPAHCTLLQWPLGTLATLWVCWPSAHLFVSLAATANKFPYQEPARSHGYKYKYGSRTLPDKFPQMDLSNQRIRVGLRPTLLSDHSVAEADKKYFFITCAAPMFQVPYISEHNSFNIANMCIVRG